MMKLTLKPCGHCWKAVELLVAVQRVGPRARQVVIPGGHRYTDDCAPYLVIGAGGILARRSKPTPSARGDNVAQR